jgi:hypothetical protein
VKVGIDRRCEVDGGGLVVVGNVGDVKFRFPNGGQKILVVRKVGRSFFGQGFRALSNPTCTATGFQPPATPVSLETHFIIPIAGVCQGDLDQQGLV